jgi:hypothetical protein
MYSLIQRVRDLTSAGDGDYTVGATAYWTDDQIQAALDRTRAEVIDEVLTTVPTVNSGGTVEYTIYESQWRNLETTTGGTAIHYLRTGNGARVGTALFTADYERGRYTFAASTGGSSLYLTARTYDLYAAAADIWRQKAAHVADRFDFTADGASFKASQLVAQYTDMAKRADAKATFGGESAHTVTMFRDDVRVRHADY